MFPRLVVAVIVALALWGALAHGSAASRHGRAYIVRPGDTVWSITVHYCGGDTRKGVWELERQNGLGEVATITPGERLRLPW